MTEFDINRFNNQREDEGDPYAPYLTLNQVHALFGLQHRNLEQRKVRSIPAPAAHAAHADRLLWSMESVWKRCEDLIRKRRAETHCLHCGQELPAYLRK